MLRVGATGVVLVVLLLLSGTECFQDADQGDSANLEGGKPGKPLPIKYHTVDGLRRIDLIDEDADDETYRAFQLARYTGDANMQVRQHEEEFMRMRREEMERQQAEEQQTELGERRGTDANDQHSQSLDRAEQRPQEQQEQQEQQQQREQSQPPSKPVNRENEIMGGNSDEEFLELSERVAANDARMRIMGSDGQNSDSDVSDLGESSDVSEHSTKDLGEGAQSKAFEAVHVAQSGDIEDHDLHFVMTDKLRHHELKNAVLKRPQEVDENKAETLAGEMESERLAVLKYQRKQAKKDADDMKHIEQKATLKSDIKDDLEKHHLQLDAKGRLVPNF